MEYRRIGGGARELNEIRTEIAELKKRETKARAAVLEAIEETGIGGTINHLGIGPREFGQQAPSQALG